jgi:uncharacterized membrane protein SpoIIM required for sporulation
MNYARFVEQRRPVWDEFDAALATAREHVRRVGHAELERLGLLYRQVLHDHALAGARFPGTGAARRLSGLALDGTHFLHRERGRGVRGPVHFLLRVFPAAFRRQAHLLAVVVPLFLVAVLAGLVLTAVRPEVAGVFLGPDALAGLEEGRLWTESLTSSVPPTVSGSGIATNNMTVALTGWAGGALAGLGSFYVVLLNGFMLGAVIAVTAHFSLAGELLAFVAAHGPLELTLIMVTAAAGLSVGRALVVAEDRPRRDVLRDAGRDSLLVVLGCLPWFVVLAVVEAVVSPAVAVPTGLKAALGLALETLFLLVATNPFTTGAGHE